MKRKLKSAVALLLLVVACFSLCSCTALDNMRKEQAFYTEDGNIIWNGKTYKQLPDTMPNIYAENVVKGGYVTDSDVPVLLSSMGGNYFTVIEPCGILSVWHNNFEDYYCLEESYDYYIELVENCVFNKYCYEVYRLSDDGKDYTEKLVIVSDEFEAAIGDILTNHRQDDMKYRYDQLYQLYLCDETKTFFGPSFEVVEVENIGYFIYVPTSGFNPVYYEIPEEYEYLFEAVYNDIQDSKNGAWEDSWTRY